MTILGQLRRESRRALFWRRPLTNVYVDGFNLYYGAVRDTEYKWLNLERLCQLLLPDHRVHRIRYFTALVTARPDDPGKPQRQQTYLRALRTLPSVSIHEGTFLEKRKRRPEVDTGRYVVIRDTEEKGSDVNLATYLLHDGHRGDYDAAVVVSNDTDLKHPIEIVGRELRLRIGILNPHRRLARDLQPIADFRKQIRKGVLRASQFPDELTDQHGTFRKPASW